MRCGVRASTTTGSSPGSSAVTLLVAKAVPQAGGGRRGEGGGGDGRRAHPSLQLDSNKLRREDLELGSHGDCGDRIGREEPVLGGEEMESEAWCFLW